MCGRNNCGYGVVELMFTTALIAILTGIAMPQLLTGLDDQRALGAARYLSTLLQRVRMEAITRSADVGMKFTLDDGGYVFGVYVDGNSNGVRTLDIRRGIDRPLGASERLGDNFSGVDFGAIPDLPPVDAGGSAPADDPIRLGAGSLATFTAKGTATTGSLYIRGRRNAQFVVRIFGETAKLRVLRFDRSTGKWKPV